MNWLQLYLDGSLTVLGCVGWFPTEQWWWLGVILLAVFVSVLVMNVFDHEDKYEVVRAFLSVSILSLTISACATSRMVVLWSGVAMAAPLVAFLVVRAVCARSKEEAAQLLV